MFSKVKVILPFILGVLQISCVYNVKSVSEIQWYKAHEKESEEILYIKVKDSHEYCKELGVKVNPFTKIFACAVYSPEVCKVYSEYSKEDIPEYIKEHEDLHCKGYSHD